uniref:G_PROTEIN_RECEP_F1_2 domain-containing protein n=1 Tax=Meloidogyne hapla TaxID=6305 RepID=A0A1I8B215_MELHA
MSLNSTSNNSNTRICQPITYINFTQYTLALLCTFTSIFNMSRLLYASKYKKSKLRVNESSNTMKLYLVGNIICG